MIIGLYCFSTFFSSFLHFLAGTVPILLILVGALIIYLNYESDSPEFDDIVGDTGDQSIKDTPSPDKPVPEKLEPTSEETSEPASDQPVREKEASEPVPVETESPPPEDYSVVESGSTEAESEETIETPADASVQLIGNTSSLVFHTSDCTYAKSKKCTENFTSKEAAIEKGYKPCGVCKP